MRSRIEWTEATWNPVTGCTKISPGCAHCYAERMALRLKAMGQDKYATGFRVALHEYVLEAPLTWRTPQMVFVNSMSDLFHAKVPPSFIQRTFGVMRRAGWHRFQILTKRSKRLRTLCRTLDWPENVWMGVTVETMNYRFRIDDLRETSAAIKFVCFEPLLENITHVDLRGIDWVIVGGESGPGARPLREEWVVNIHDQCQAAGIPFFFKQWGGVNKKQAGRLLRGRTWDQLPLAQL